MVNAFLCCVRGVCIWRRARAFGCQRAKREMENSLNCLFLFTLWPQIVFILILFSFLPFHCEQTFLIRFYLPCGQQSTFEVFCLFFLCECTRRVCVFSAAPFFHAREEERKRQSSGHVASVVQSLRQGTAFYRTNVYAHEVWLTTGGTLAARKFTSLLEKTKNK